MGIIVISFTGVAPKKRLPVQNVGKLSVFILFVQCLTNVIPMVYTRETARLPEKKGVYKFIQLEIDTKHYLIFGGFFHASILNDALAQKGIRFNTEERWDGPENPEMGQRQGRKYSIPASSGDRYRLHGAGWANISDHTINFYGHSEDYDIGPNYTCLQSLKELYPDWTFSAAERN